MDQNQTPSNCPYCNFDRLVRERRRKVVSLRGKREPVELDGWWCESCDEGLLDEPSLIALEDCISRLRDVARADASPDDVALDNGTVVWRPGIGVERVKPPVGETQFSDERIAFLNKVIVPRRLRTAERLEQQWVATFADAATTLAASRGSASWMVEAAFWTRIHGLLSDARTRYRKVGTTFETLGLTPLQMSLLPKDHLVTVALARRNYINQIYELYSRDELIFIDYLRQTSCHFSQDGYGPQWHSKKNQWQEHTHYPPKTLDTRLTKDECIEAIGRVHSRFSAGGVPHENLIALEFALRVVPILPQLLESFGIAADGSRLADR